MNEGFNQFRAFLSRYAEWLVLLLVVLCATVAGGAFLFGVVGPLGPDHSNELVWFSPSVMFASGRGMICPAEMDIPALSDFLRMRKTAFNPADIPDAFNVWDLSPFCRSHYYLMMAVGTVWRCFGISWESVKLVPLVLFAVAAAFMYGLFRLGMGRLLSALFSLAVMCSPPMLGMTVSIRDFSKAPFILGALYLASLLAVRPRSRRSLFGLSALLGLFLGIGMGFRQDAMIALPPALAAAALARGAVPFRWWMRLAAPAVMLAAFLFTGAPILRALRIDDGAVSSHTLFQGLSLETESSLDFSGASYFLLTSPADNLVHSVVNTYARRRGDTDPMENYLSPAYGRAGRRMFLEVAGNFPADLIDRGYAAVSAVFRVPGEFPKQMAYAKGMDNDPMRGLVRLYEPLAVRFDRWGVLCAVLALAVIGAYDLRAALVAAFALLYFGGYTSLLFQYRHAFHLTFMPWWAAAFLLAVAGRGAAALCRRLRAPEGLKALPLRAAAARIARACALVAAAAAALVLPLSAARVWQHARVDRMVRACADAPMEPMETLRDTLDGRVMIRPAERPKGLVDSETRPPMEVSWEYMAVEVDTGGRLIPITIEYDKRVFGNNFTHTVNVEPPPDGMGGTVRFLFPVYEVSAIPPPEGELTVYTQPIPWHRGRFLGVSVAEQDAGCVKAISRVSDTASLNLLPHLWLPRDTAAFRWHNSTTVEGRLGAVWAGIAARAGNPDAALARYRELLCWHPAEPLLYDGVDALLRRNPDRWDLPALWRKIADTHADQPYARAKLAVALTDAGRFAEARAVLQAVTDKIGLRSYLCDAYLYNMLKSGDFKGSANYIRWCRENNGPISRAAARAAEKTIRRAEAAAP
jgi:hypothetical protein